MTDSVLDIPVKRIDGGDTTLADYRGKVIMVVNVASKCGLTVQYEALEKLYEDKRDEGLVIAGFPANDFKGQEPGTNEDILSFCTLTYDVQFPMFSKIAVTGQDRHPLYNGLIASGVEATGDGPMRERLAKHGLETGQDGGVVWNFEKFLIGRNGKVVARFAPDVTPDDPRLLSVLEKELAQSN
ncbi:glutathione peroxidase [Rhizobium lusitanum]|uniref:Glutathione peroxidase n=1 Tax=Rhizobium lusitanum TaxID=293958 RepID=A0A7X0IVG2_9HYPH|nr:glutathione peroxidase [Rhizobium lusitanum]MBB6487347.1 glutathione peroxidase [Rhizobium lusitanum]